MNLKQSEINTLNRIGIDYGYWLGIDDEVLVENRFGGGSCVTTPFIAHLINWVYQTSNAYELGLRDVRLDDFDRVRYLIMREDQKAYMTCLD